MKKSPALLLLTFLSLACIPASASIARKQSRMTLTTTRTKQGPARRTPFKAEPKNDVEVYTARSPDEMDAESDFESARPLPGTRAKESREDVRAESRTEERTEERAEAQAEEHGIDSAAQPVTDEPMERPAPSGVRTRASTQALEPAIPVGPAALGMGALPGARASSKNYDYVSPAHRDSVADRLVYVEELLVKHGRAYDYRSHTTRELKGILEQLNGTMRD